MQYLWIGVGNSEEGRAHIVENGGKLLSAEVSNDALVAGLEANGIFPDTINSSRLPTYPHYKEKRVTPYRWTTSVGTTGESVGYLNLPYINLLSKKRALVKAAKAWAKKHVHDEVTVFIYQMHTPFMAAASAVKKIIPTATVVLIVPDLPQYMDMNMSTLKKILKKLDWQSIRRHMKKVDRYILYSIHMAEFLGLADGSFTVMEGSFDASLLPNCADEEEKDGAGGTPTAEDDGAKDDARPVSVMYSGVLDLRYGVPELLDAFALLGENYELWLTGNGNAVPLIEERASTDSRIKYYGFLPSREALLQKQREASMLISTRDPSEVASAYCFPSKIFEYMVSGNPVLSTKIKGIPDEYFDRLIALPDLQPESIAKTIEQTAAWSYAERKAFGQAARTFIIEEKNNVAQARRILDFLNHTAPTDAKIGE